MGKQIMEKKTFKITNISCEHCVMTIKNELGEMAGIRTVNGNIDTKTIFVEWEATASLDTIKAKLNEINYPAE
jgi:copper chaperone CopZ